MRVSKAPEVRKAEILDAAERLFITKGYGKATIIDIINAVGIAKGTFYYHFKSKEEVLDAIIIRVLDTKIAVAQSIADDETLAAIEKLIKIIRSLNSSTKDIEFQLAKEISITGNIEMQHKIMIASISGITPIIAQAIEQGISKGEFSGSEYIYEIAELLVSAVQVVFNITAVAESQAALMRKMLAFTEIIETLLGVEKGRLSEISKIL